MTIHPRHTKAAAIDAEYLPTFHQRVADVAQHCGIARRNLLSMSRKRIYVRPRQLLYWLLHNDGIPAAAIARMVGVDHTAVVHGIRSHESRLIPLADPDDICQDANTTTTGEMI
jgi:chromosomal replication initiation ATPase DnaA